MNNFFTNLTLMLFAPSNPYDTMLHKNSQPAATFMAAEHHGRELKQTIIPSSSLKNEQKDKGFNNTINSESWEDLSNRVKWRKEKEVPNNEILAYNDFGNHNKEPFDYRKYEITLMAVRYHGKSNNEVSEHNSSSEEETEWDDKVIENQQVPRTRMGTPYHGKKMEKYGFNTLTQAEMDQIVPKRQTEITSLEKRVNYDKNGLPRVAKMVAWHHGKKYFCKTDMSTDMATSHHGRWTTKMATRNHGKIAKTENTERHVNPFSSP